MRDAAPHALPEHGRQSETPVVLSVDVGGSHVKVLTNRPGDKLRRISSGSTMTAKEMVAAVKVLTQDLSYDVMSIGYPGPVRADRILQEPMNLGKGWSGADFSLQFGKPVKVVNDALMQAIGSYDGGRMLFLGLGTGLGAALILDHVAHPLEIAHLPYRHKKTIEDYVGERGIKRRGKKKWRKSVNDVAERLMAALLPDYIVIGGGNVDELETLPANCRRGDNAFAFRGGFRLWDGTFVVS
ncbi:ROK family protein [Rhizobium sp. SSA_523]|uniref:ROK family protein n=1 Tax=Rhizobium sp. SSA_523 TaxID=2952477 RepID=UPI0020905468|nr:ROK family protein [Rhizobium sp. SSA_523]MCO5731473.1 ROK family protein [Rhizobium sp. SSA_523]WKC22009.1 ROK family protein [Rhizobium sp. SSA_523]